MRIGFTGVHGSGKSTLLREMIGWSELNGHAFISGLTRAQARNNGVVINQGGNFEGQKTLVKAMAWHLKTLPNLVIDRTLIDIYAYTVHHRDHNSLTSQELNYIRTQARKYQSLFDVVFYIQPEFDVIQDGVRPTDPAFVVEVAANIHHTITLGDALDSKKIVNLSGTVEQRLTTIKEWLNESQA